MAEKDPVADRGEPRYRACHGEVLQCRGLAGVHRVAAELGQRMSLGGRRGKPHPPGPGGHSGVEASLELIREKLGDGRLHALVDNAGISPKGEGGERLGVLETDYATWLRVFNVNLFSTALLARGLFAELKAAQGTVINVTSIAGSKVHPFAGVAYATSKAALSALTREMAHDFGPHGVRVNAIAPGEIDTSILSPGTEEIVERSIPLHRLGRPEEIASLIYFLCTSGASYVNGAEIHVNGGQHV